MKKAIYMILAAITIIGLAGCGTMKDNTKKTNDTVIFETDMGNFEVELYKDKAPVTVDNFLGYVNDGFYNGLIFHRTMDGFMIQGGGFDKSMKQKQTKAPIKNEAANGLKNEKYTLAMARTGVIDSATSQFFINTANNEFLNHKDNTVRGYGYAVFGKVVSGFDVVDKIATAPVKENDMGEPSDPVNPVVIKKIYLK